MYRFDVSLRTLIDLKHYSIYVFYSGRGPLGGEEEDHLFDRKNEGVSVWIRIFEEPLKDVR